jgi:Protein of unknown function (DUF3298)
LEIGLNDPLRKILFQFIFPVLLLGLLSCNILSTSTTPGATPTQLSLYQGLALTSRSFNETGSSPLFALTALVPQLDGSNDSRVLQFNQQVDVLVQQEVDAFKQSLSAAPNPPIAMGSSFNLKSTLISPWSDILSLKFVIDSYFDGAAHPGQYSRAFTFDLTTGHQVNLDLLFLPGSDYLQVLSDYCKSELAKRPIAFDATNTGADPLPGNYLNWNISADGLLITFDAYQVAAYAAGPQVVTVPYSELAPIIDSLGPLGGFLP